MYLQLGDASALILVSEDGRYLLQKRDCKPGIWYPGKWGCFGGSTNQGETPVGAALREAKEEIGFAPADLQPFCSFNFDLSDQGKRLFYRRYFSATITLADISSIRLGEGSEFGLFSLRDIEERLDLTPYDSFALFLHGRKNELV